RSSKFIAPRFGLSRAVYECAYLPLASAMTRDSIGRRSGTLDLERPADFSTPASERHSNPGSACCWLRRQRVVQCVSQVGSCDDLSTSRRSYEVRRVGSFDPDPDKKTDHESRCGDGKTQYRPGAKTDALAQPLPYPRTK